MKKEAGSSLPLSRKGIVITAHARLFWVLWVLVFGYDLKAQTAPFDSVYQLRTAREISLLGAGLVANGGAFLVNRGVIPFTPVQIDEINPGNINAFDRGAIQHWSPAAARFSDITLLSTVGLVGLTGLPTLRQKKWFTVPLMYAETMLLTVGVQDFVKVTTLRTRPFVYNSKAPLSEKIGIDARRSFFSGHSAVSFGSAVFASTVFGHYFPISKLKPVVWAGSLALATTTAVLRYEAGKHFPSDILVGAAFGSAVGWLVPYLHRHKPRLKHTVHQFDVLPWSNGVASGFYMQVRLN